MLGTFCYQTQFPFYHNPGSHGESIQFHTRLWSVPEGCRITFPTGVLESAVAHPTLPVCWGEGRHFKTGQAMHCKGYSPKPLH